LESEGTFTISSTSNGKSSIMAVSSSGLNISSDLPLDISSKNDQLSLSSPNQGLFINGGLAVNVDSQGPISIRTNNEIRIIGKLLRINPPK
jgi:hypothetical protein